MIVTFYRFRQAKGAAWSALKVWHGHPVDPDTGETLTDRPALHRAMLNGEHVPIESVMIEMDGQTGRPMIKAEKISEEDYKLLLADVTWAREHAPTSPEANPRKTVDPLTAPLPW